MSQSPERARGEVMQALPALICQTMETYTGFCAQTPPAAHKEFAAFQAGCKAALSHLEALLRLQRALEAHAPTPEAPCDAAAGREGSALNDLVREARTAVGQLRGAP